MVAVGYSDGGIFLFESYGQNWTLSLDMDVSWQTAAIALAILCMLLTTKALS